MAATSGAKVPPGMSDAARRRADWESWMVKPSSMEAYTCRYRRGGARSREACLLGPSCKAAKHVPHVRTAFPS